MKATPCIMGDSVYNHMYHSGMRTTEAKVTANGQVSLPAELRRRWHAPAVLVIDRGDYAIMRPVPEDPITALRGAYAGAGPTTEEARAADRADETWREEDRAGEPR